MLSTDTYQKKTFFLTEKCERLVWVKAFIGKYIYIIFLQNQILINNNYHYCHRWQLFTQSIRRPSFLFLIFYPKSVRSRQGEVWFEITTLHLFFLIFFFLSELDVKTPTIPRVRNDPRVFSLNLQWLLARLSSALLYWVNHVLVHGLPWCCLTSFTRQTCPAGLLLQHQNGYKGSPSLRWNIAAAAAGTSEFGTIAFCSRLHTVRTCSSFKKTKTTKNNSFVKSCVLKGFVEQPGTVALL